jgi:hypothetical protein
MNNIEHNKEAQRDKKIVSGYAKISVLCALLIICSVGFLAVILAPPAVYYAYKSNQLVKTNPGVYQNYGLDLIGMVIGGIYIGVGIYLAVLFLVRL